MTSDKIIVRCGACRTLNNVPAEKLKARPLCGQCKAPLSVPHAPVEGTGSTFDQELGDWPGALLVEFWAKWCGYCRMVEPVVNDLANWRAGTLKVIRVDIDSEPALAKQFKVHATPTFILFRNGGQAARMDGAPKEKIDLVQWVDHHLPRP